jgi:MFS superfamily sulfate permease-like transporter
MPDDTQKQTNRIARYIPLLQWVSQYDRGWLRFDLIYGLTVAAMVVATVTRWLALSMPS